jgi:hypothetical protein
MQFTFSHPSSPTEVPYHFVMHTQNHVVASSNMGFQHSAWFSLTNKTLCRHMLTVSAFHEIDHINDIYFEIKLELLQVTAVSRS